MKIFEGKSPAERNKIIAAMVLGLLAVISLGYTFGGIFFRGKSTTSVTVSTSPTVSATPNNGQTAQNQITTPNEDAIYQEYTVIPVNYMPNNDFGGIGGRNIFAFYEPGPPAPQPSFVPRPTTNPNSNSKTPQIPVFTPPPQATPYPIQISFISPQSVYQGSKIFRLQVIGDKFTPESKIVFNGNVLQTTFVDSQNLYADVPASLLQNPSNFSIYVDNFDGKNLSNQVSFIVQAPPKPQLEYIGMIARKHYNNDTAYFQKTANDEPFGKRLGDEVDGRFKLVSISEKEVEFVDKQLGFRHKLRMKRPDESATSGGNTNPGSTIFNSPSRRNPGVNPNPNINNGDCIPGIPCDLPRATPNPNMKDPTIKP